jgi:hypothetical protein
MEMSLSSVQTEEHWSNAMHRKIIFAIKVHIFVSLFFSRVLVKRHDHHNRCLYRHTAKVVTQISTIRGGANAIVQTLFFNYSFH